MAKPRLLVIDDEPALADFVAKAAELSGYSPTVTEEDTDFREKLVAEDPAVVVLDLGMPGSDGVELLRFLADQGFSGPVLLISGFDRRVIESATRLGSALGLNMIGPLEKPARLEELEDLLKQLKPSLAG